MTATIIPERLAKLDKIKLISGHGPTPPNGKPKGCVMDIVSWIAGERWTDRPECASPVADADAVAAAAAAAAAVADAVASKKKTYWAQYDAAYAVAYKFFREKRPELFAEARDELLALLDRMIEAKSA